MLLLTIYTGSAVGISINYHYCHGHLTKISLLNFGNKGGCGCNPKEMPKGCCKDELKYLKIDNHKTIQIAQTSEFVSLAIEPIPSNNYYPIPPIDVYHSNLNKNGIQRSCPQPIFLLNRVFRI